MTVIAARIKKNGSIVMGCDTCVSNGYSQSITKAPKVFIHNKFIIGTSGNIRTANILQHRFRPPTMTQGQSEDDYLFTSFIDHLRTTLRDSGAMSTDEGTDQMGATLLLGHDGRLFYIYADFGIVESPMPYGAVGSGAMAALGSFHATSEKNMDAKRQVMTAMEAAAEHACGVRGPFHLLTLRQT